jgi:hypothetical protein
VRFLMTVKRLNPGEASPAALPRSGSARAGIQGPDLRHEFISALQAWEQLTPNDAARALRQVGELRCIRSRIRAFAQRLGYTRACKEALPSCSGECCKLHFPRDINRVDLFVALCGRTQEEAAALSCRIGRARGLAARCALLGERGCLFAFADRPIVCASAYPCFATREYWEFLQTHKPRIDALYGALQKLLEL